MNYPKISVFLPVYNQEAYISEAIESILIQDYPNIEVIAGDDGSTDGTVAILKKYQERYPGIFELILSPVNTGITANCNRILKACTGDYIALFAGDDIWLPGKLKRQISYLLENPNVSLCATKGDVFESSSGLVLRVEPDLEVLGKCNNIFTIARTLGGCGCSFVIPKWAIPEDGFNIKMPNTSDWLFWIEVLGKGKLGYIDEHFFRYRRGQSNFSLKSRTVALEHLLTLEILLDKNNFNKEDVYRCMEPPLLIFINNLNDRNFSYRVVLELLEKLDNDEMHCNLLEKIFEKMSVRLIVNVTYQYFFKHLNRNLRKCKGFFQRTGEKILRIK